MIGTLENRIGGLIRHYSTSAAIGTRFFNSYIIFILISTMKCTGIQQQPKSRSVKNEIELHRKNSKCFWTENVFGQHSIEKCKAS